MVHKGQTERSLWGNKHNKKLSSHHMQPSPCIRGHTNLNIVIGLPETRANLVTSNEMDISRN